MVICMSLLPLCSNKNNRIVSGHTHITELISLANALIGTE